MRRKSPNYNLVAKQVRKTLQTAGGSRPRMAKLEDQPGSLSEKIFLDGRVVLLSTNTIMHYWQLGQLPNALQPEYFAVVGR